MKQINICGAHLHNLKNIDVSIPKNKLVVTTGVSGSGKSTLVFDILYEEGRKLYLQSLGIYNGMDDEYKFDSIKGIGPTIAVQQNIIRQSNPRSTVGSKTGILNSLALLYAAEGRIVCRQCGSKTGSNLICSECGYENERYPAGFFSYNNPNGMCLSCSGRGAYYQIDLERLIPEEVTTLEQILDAIKVTPGLRNVFYRHFGEYVNIPFKKIPDEVKADILYGHFVNSNGSKRSISVSRILEGHLRKYQSDPTGLYQMGKCPDCQGSRIGDEARSVTLNGFHIGQLGFLTLDELEEFLSELQRADLLGQSMGNPINELLVKIRALVGTRLGHLSLYREMPSLSGGELQRLFLTSHLDSRMDSLIYVLDEPTSGLHEKEKPELLNYIRELRETGNTLIVVEHDKTIIEAAEHIIDMGPEAGEKGGRLIYEGDLQGLLDCDNSITGKFLSGKSPMPKRKKIPYSEKSPSITLINARTNNLKNLTVTFPLGMIVGIAGMSGSGKSSLISETLVPLLKEAFHSLPGEGGMNGDILIETAADKLVGATTLMGFVEVSQAPIGRNMSSNPASYIGVWDKIRKVFSNQKAATDNGMSHGDFSFNSKGACSSCGGSGVDKIWLGGNMFVSNVCGDCNGTRYKKESLAIRYNDKNIRDVLEMTVTEALHFFESDPAIVKNLQVMEDIGMGYIKMGQPTPTLSGGEAQRIKLAKEIGRKKKEHIMYIFDEPTSGLSLYDTAKLLLLLDELVKKGNSVLVIEHDPTVLSSCDWIIELGPEGGTKGGLLIAEGTPDEIKVNPNSVTGEYLI